MTKATETVDALLARLDHPLNDGVEQLRPAILAAHDGLSEHVKWNAPSYVYEGEDRVTFRLNPAGGIQLVFHRGAKKRDDTATFTFDDPTGLIEWAARDRGVVTFTDLEDVREKTPAVVSLVFRWLEA